MEFAVQAHSLHDHVERSQAESSILFRGTSGIAEFSLHFVTCGGPSHRESLVRIADEARAVGVFETINAFNEEDLMRMTSREPQLPHEVLSRCLQNFGLGLWKVLCLEHMMFHVHDGDVLFWADVGCTINTTSASRQKLLDLASRVRAHSSGVLRFNSSKKEHTLTDRYIFEQIHLDAWGDNSSLQLIGNRFVMQKCSASAKQLADLFEELVKVPCSSDEPRHDQSGFDHHRFDQSVFSLVSKRCGCLIEKLSEIEVSIATLRKKCTGAFKNNRNGIAHIMADLPDNSWISPERVFSDILDKYVNRADSLAAARDLQLQHGLSALHVALDMRDEGAAAWLICNGSMDLLEQKSKSGCTALMLLAMGRCKGSQLNEALIWRFLSRARPSLVADRSIGGLSAADYARDNRLSKDIISLIESAEKRELQLTADDRCRVCGNMLDKRPRLAYFADRAREGKEDNQLLQRFFEKDLHQILLQPHYHQISSMRSIRKELSESMAMLETLEENVSTFGSGWHVVDLCCGKSVTAALLSARHSDVIVSAIDKISPRSLPHFNRIEGCHVKYIQMDVLSSSFIQELQKLVKDVARPTALLGMHLCGFLSTCAIQCFEEIDYIEAIVLAPCCLPNQSDPRSPLELYVSRNGVEQYKAWGMYLESLLITITSLDRVTSRHVLEVLSPRNIVICAGKCKHCIAKRFENV